MVRKLLLVSTFAILSVPALAFASDDPLQVRAATYTDAAGKAPSFMLFGGEQGDLARSIVCSKDGSCTLFGYSNGSFDHGVDFLVVHQTPKSDVAWAETFGGTNQEALYTAIPASDGGYFTLGSSASMFFTGLKVFSPRHDPRPFYVKLDASGKPSWAGNVELSTDISHAEMGEAVQTADGGYLLSGIYLEDYPGLGRRPMPDEWSGPPVGDTKGWEYHYPLVVKLAADGKPQWMRRYSFDGHGGEATSLALMPSGHALLVGSIDAVDHSALFVMEMDEQGQPLHAQRYDDLPRSLGSNAAVRLQDGGYAVVGHAVIQKGERRAFAMRLSAEGKFVSGKLYSYPTGVRPLGLLQAADGKVYVAGRSEDGANNKAEGVAWAMDGDSVDLGELWLSGQGNTEIEGIAQLSSGELRLVGDTAAFGAQNFDVLEAGWVPGAATARRLSVEPFAPKLSDITVTMQTGKLDVVRNIPVGLMKFQVLKTPAP